MIRWILLLFVTLLLGLGIFSWAHIPWSLDSLLAVLPDYSVNLQAYTHGFLPLWDPTSACGHPHLAKWLPACLYPPCGFLVLSGIQGLFPLVFFHAGWAFLGFFLWLRSQKSSLSLAILGALSFTLSSHFIRCWLDAPFTFTLSWIPWIFWALDRTLRKPGSPWRLAAALFLALQILAGYPIFVFYTWILLGAWLLHLSPSGKNWKDLVLALGLALGLSLAQWLPFLEFLPGAVRGNWESFPYFTRFSECLTLLNPALAGDPALGNYHGDRANGNFGNLYFGLIPLGLFLAQWIFYRRSQTRFWNFASLGFFLWLLGPNFPLLRIVPEKTLEFLVPSKAVGLFLFAACTSVALGFSPRLENQRPKGFRWVCWIGGALWALDLLTLPFRILHWVPNPYLDKSLSAVWRDFAQRTNGFRTVSLLLPAQWTAPSLEELCWNSSKHLMVNSNTLWGIRSPDGYFSTETQALSNLSRYFRKGYPYRGDLIDLAGVKFLVLPQLLPVGKYKPVGRIGDDYVLLNSQAAPRGWRVDGYSDFPNRPSILSALTGAGNPWRQKVFLEKNPDDSKLSLPPASRDLTPLTTENTGEFQPASRMNFSTNGLKPGYWIFNETCSSGWRAWVDGKPKPILRAYGLFMAVSLGPGSHRIDFRYEPVSFRLGLFFSLLALTALGTGSVGYFFRPNSSAPPRPRRRGSLRRFLRALLEPKTGQRKAGAPPLSNDFPPP